jgi:hypothetical protein
MKKLLSAMLVAAVVVAVAPVAASAQSACPAYTFTQNLKQGARSSEVVALQTFLEVNNLLTIPAGVSKGYFGTATKRAVAAYQASKGITPAVGYFGPTTRGQANADWAAKCSMTTPTNPTTPVTPTAPVVSGSAEGAVDVKQSASPVNNFSVQTSSNVPVYGLELRGRISPVTVATLDLQVDVVNGSASENPSTLINEIKVTDGVDGAVLLTTPVNSSSFTKDSNNKYWIRLSGINLVVNKDEVKNLVVAFTTANIDSNRTVTVKGYNSTALRTVSSNGVSNFYDVASFTRTHIFQKPGTSVLTLSSYTTPLRSQNFRVLPNGEGVKDVKLVNFNLRSQTGTSKITSVRASTTFSGSATAANTVFKLYDGSRLLQSATAVGGSVSFTNIDSSNVTVEKETIKTLTIAADMTAVGTVQATVPANGVDYETPNGSTKTADGSAVVGEAMVGVSAGPQFTLTSVVPSTKTNTSQNGTSSTDQVEVNFTFAVKADGASVTKFEGVSNATSGIDVTVTYLNSSNVVSTIVKSATLVTTPNQDIADGSTATVAAKVVLNNSDITNVTGGSSTELGFAVSTIRWTAIGSTPTTQTYGLADFKLPSTVTFKK